MCPNHGPIYVVGGPFKVLLEIPVFYIRDFKSGGSLSITRGQVPFSEDPYCIYIVSRPGALGAGDYSKDYDGHFLKKHMQPRTHKARPGAADVALSPEIRPGWNFEGRDNLRCREEAPTLWGYEQKVGSRNMQRDLHECGYLLAHRFKTGKRRCL